MTFKWQNPTTGRPGRPAAGARTAHDEAAAKLKTKPGKWAIIAEFTRPESAYSQAYRLRRGEVRSFPKGKFEFTGQKSDVTGKGLVYGRYVG